MNLDHLCPKNNENHLSWEGGKKERNPGGRGKGWFHQQKTIIKVKKLLIAL
jgi:hypothetical protein